MAVAQSLHTFLFYHLTPQVHKYHFQTLLLDQFVLQQTLLVACALFLHHLQRLNPSKTFQTDHFYQNCLKTQNLKMYLLFFLNFNRHYPLPSSFLTGTPQNPPLTPYQLVIVLLFSFLIPLCVFSHLPLLVSSVCLHLKVS